MPVQPVPPAVFAHRREESGVHSFALHPQHHDDVAFGEHGVQVIGNSGRPRLHPHRQQRGRGDQGDLRTQRGQQHHIGPRHSAVQHVAHDGHVEPGDPAVPAAHRESVQQRLGGMFVRPVPGVEHAAANPTGEPVRGTAGAVANHDGVGAHRLQRQGSVLEALALGHAGALRREVDDVGGQPLGGDLEGRAGAGRILEEQVHDRAAAQRRQLLHRPVGQAAHLLRRVQDEHRLVTGQIGGREQVAAHRRPSLVAPGRSGTAWGAACPTSTASRPSTSSSRTCTTSAREVGMFLPT